MQIKKKINIFQIQIINLVLISIWVVLIIFLHVRLNNIYGIIGHLINNTQTQYEQIEDLRKNRILKPIEVTVTAYSPRESETDDTPYTTAFMQKVKPGQIAVSRDLFNDGWIAGKSVYIDQIGVFVIADLMHPRKKKHLDVFFNSTNEAIEFGIKKSKAILLEL